MPSRAASSDAARAANTAPDTATTTGESSTCSSRTSPSPRRRVSPSSDGGPSRNVQRGLTTSRTRTVAGGGDVLLDFNCGAAGGRRSGTSSTTRSRRSAPTSCASWPPAGAAARDDRDRRGPRDEPGRGQRGGLPGRHGGATAAGRVLDDAALRDHGEAVDDLRLLNFWSSSTTKERHYRPRRTCMVPNTRSQYGALIPKPRSSSWKWWRMCSSRSHFPSRVRGVWWCRW